MKPRLSLYVLSFLALSLIAYGGSYIYSHGNLGTIGRLTAAGELTDEGQWLRLGAVLSDTVHLKRVDVAPCHDEEGRPSEYFWGIAHVTHDDPAASVMAAEGSVTFYNTQGEVVGALPFSNLNWAAGSTNWLTYPRLLNYGQVFEIAGGQFKEARLEISPLQAGLKADYTVTHFRATAELISHSVTAGQYPRHSLQIGITNTGSVPMLHTRVFAAVHNSRDELVDLDWSEEVGTWPVGAKISPGGNAVLSLKSLARSGRCLGEADPAGYLIDYWVDAMTPSGLPVSIYESVPVQ